jgi:glutamate carboxypeptidase
MEESPLTLIPFHRAQEIGRELGLVLTSGGTGGASDGNFTAALGVPTLDGMGAIGDDVHAVGEHVRISSLPERAALMAALLTRW